MTIFFLIYRHSNFNSKAQNFQKSYLQIKKEIEFQASSSRNPSPNIPFLPVGNFERSQNFFL